MLPCSTHCCSSATAWLDPHAAAKGLQEARPVRPDRVCIASGRTAYLQPMTAPSSRCTQASMQQRAMQDGSARHHHSPGRTALPSWPFCSRPAPGELMRLAASASRDQNSFVSLGGP